ncbi:ABC transporter permease [Halosolutus halophilus]|uniref:ABC transporter permease n=1 Tax=Halosolutus halophilus TaxID=1552990 RepID=UPI002234F16E|nr:ABC transporter permease [Halosolutus halophilus]
MSTVDTLVGGWQFLMENFDQFLVLLREHLTMVLLAEVLALAVALPLGVFAIRDERSKRVILSFGNVAQTIPTLAIIALAFPILGLGFKPSVLALFAYALLPILINTIAGLDEVSEDTVEAAKGMGMTEMEILRKIRFPLAIPVIFAGIRTSAVINVGTAYLAFFIGGGGLGVWVIGGINLFNMEQMVAGAVPGALLAIGLDTLFAMIERRLGGQVSIDSVPA